MTTTEKTTTTETPQAAATDVTHEQEGQITDPTLEGTIDALGAHDGTEGPEIGNKAGRDAAKYRRQLRETESERDSLAGNVDSLRRQIVSSNMPKHSQLNVDALWATGRTPAEMFTPDGAFDAEKLTAAMQELHGRFGIRMGPPLPEPIPRSGYRRGDPATYHTDHDGPTWSDAVQKTH